LVDTNGDSSPPLFLQRASQQVLESLLPTLAKLPYSLGEQRRTLAATLGTFSQLLFEVTGMWK
jgi:hypothetical protein